MVHAGEAELFHQGALILAIFSGSSLLFLNAEQRPLVAFSVKGHHIISDTGQRI